MKKLIIILILLISVAGITICYVTDIKEKNQESSKTIDKTTIKDKYGSSDEIEEVELKYDQYIIANGYTGASDNVYYTRNGVLYHLQISTEQTIKLAEGVKKIESDLDGMRAYKGDNFKIKNEDEYVTYVD